MPRGTESIEVDYPLEHPPQEVWRLLTDPRLLAMWLMPNDIAPAVGHKFNFRTKPMGETAWSIARCWSAAPTPASSIPGRAV
jgi:uncharacterized protein YndB with AHSA1/START domain